MKEKTCKDCVYWDGHCDNFGSDKYLQKTGAEESCGKFKEKPDEEFRKKFWKEK